MKKIIIIIIIFVFLVISFIFSIRFLNKSDSTDKKSELLKNVFIEEYHFDKQQDNDVGTIKLKAVNLNNKILSHLPVKIDYYLKDGTYISSDFCDVLNFTKSAISPTQKAEFQIEVSFPKGTEFIKIKVDEK